jgi:hypothetical protein
MKRRHVSEGVGDHPPEQSPWIGRSHTAKLAAPVALDPPYDTIPTAHSIVMKPVWAEPPHLSVCMEHDMVEPCPKCEGDPLFNLGGDAGHFNRALIFHKVKR